MRLAGRLTLRRIAQGSKSERDVVCLIDENGDQYIVRAAGSLPFEVDEGLRGRVGTSVVLNGNVEGLTFLYDRIE